MSLDITGFDMFCGAGGTTSGFVAAGGRMVGAANHWPRALESHNTNFPDVDHYLANISLSDPRAYPKTDVLLASPECVNHTTAKNGKAKRTLWNADDPKFAAEERSRATMWDVVRFSEFHRYQVVIVENVVEARRWDLYEPWLIAMHALGYEHRAVYINSMIAFPTPQSRDRMYVVFWRKGNPAPDLEIRPKAWCAVHGDVEAIQSWKNPLRPWGKYRAQYVYRCPTCAAIALPYAWPAAAAIDWSLPAQRIGDRKRPLADATVRRIQAGLARYGFGAIVQGAGNTYERGGYYRTWPLWQPLGTQMGTIQHGLVLDYGYEHVPQPAGFPARTVTGEHDQALVVDMRQGSASRVRHAMEPLGTQVATSSVHGLLVGINYAHAADAPRTRPTEDPWPTQTGQQDQALLVTMRGTSDAAIAATTRDPREPIGPQTTQLHDALVVPLRTHGQAIPVGNGPVPTVVAGNAGHALLMRNYSGGAEMSKPIEAPAGTITSRDHHALLVDYHGAGKPGRSTDEPHRTMDSRDRYGLVEPSSIDIEDCGFRMLEPHEIKWAMAFPDEYVILGDKREQVKQAGNAVTPPVSTMLTELAVFGTLSGGRAA